MKKSILYLFVITGLLLTACKKDPPVYPFRISVEDEEGDRVTGAYVLVRANAPGSDVKFEDTTDAFGQVYFEYDYEAVFNVQAQYIEIIEIDSAEYISFYYQSCGLIKLEEDGEVQLLLTLEDWDPMSGGCF